MIDELLSALAAADVPANALNPYGRTGPLRKANAIRRENLARYLAAMQRRSPRALLVGEAPSYRGGRLTGIPFVSETLLLRGIDSIGMLGTVRGYHTASEWETPSTEASATMVWATIREIEPLPLLWNAFPSIARREAGVRRGRAESSLR